MNSSLVREPVTVLGGHHGGVRRVVILGRGGAGKSALSRQLSEATGIPAVELDALFWQPGPVPMDPGQWAEGQHDLVQRASWILTAIWVLMTRRWTSGCGRPTLSSSWTSRSCDARGGLCAEAVSRRNTGAGCGLTGAAASR